MILIVGVLTQLFKSSLEEDLQRKIKLETNVNWFSNIGTERHLKGWNWLNEQEQKINQTMKTNETLEKERIRIETERTRIQQTLNDFRKRWSWKNSAEKIIVTTTNLPFLSNVNPDSGLTSGLTANDSFDNNTTKTSVIFEDSTLSMLSIFNSSSRFRLLGGFKIVSKILLTRLETNIFWCFF
jgi:hypothetical protein